MNVFTQRNSLIEDYSSYISSFIQIKDKKIEAYINQSIEQDLRWPNPLIQLNPILYSGKINLPVIKEDNLSISQLTLSDFGLYKYEICGKMVMGFKKANHEQEKHGGKSVEWKKIR